MNRRSAFFFASLAISAGMIFCCSPAENTGDDNQTTVPENIIDFKLSVPVTENWVFDKRPNLTIHVENPNEVKVVANAKIAISTDLKAQVVTLEKSAEVPASGKLDIQFTTDSDLAPGFYRAICSVNGRLAKNFFFGISPFQIVSAPDMQEDFNQFWENSRNQLPKLDETTVKMHPIEKKSTSSCKVYMVEMQSVPDGLEGEPVIVRGYYLEPQDGQKHPVIMHFFGYDSQPNPGKMSCPSGNSGNYAEFYLSHRGQYINSRPASKRDDGLDMDFENIYGDWFAYNFGDKNGYYYRGAFMDCVQAVRFMATRETSDMGNLFAEGSSQGGALCYAAAALSDYPFTAIAPNVAFLGDFPDYFRIVDWPASTAKKNKGAMTDEQMYAFLSYFDTKNLATRISCAVYATSGLQDGTCPPHTNLAPFMNLKSTDKEMHFYPEMTHDYPPGWTSTIMKYFKERIK